MNRKQILAVGGAVAFAATAFAGVCKIGSTEYDSLQAAFNSKKNANVDFTMTLLQDIDVTSEITVPTATISSGSPRVCTVDGGGHYIRQAYAGRIFAASNNYTHIVFRDVTILGGGEEFATGDDVPGAFFLTKSGGMSSLTLDSGCVVSNFVFHSTLVGNATASAGWNIYVNPGSVIAYNRASSSPGIFRLFCWARNRGLYINGGEIYGNSAAGQTIAYIHTQPGGTESTVPLCTISGGSIHDNVATDATTSTGLFFCNEGPLFVSMTGGDIFDNTGTAFYINGNACRIHLSGGKIFANTGYGVYDKPQVRGSMRLSGDAVVSGNGPNGRYGLYEPYEYAATARTALEGDFTGYVYLSGLDGSSRRQVGQVYGTNLASWVGAENIHIGEWKDTIPLRVLVTDTSTGNLVWQEPKSAKIGSTEYDTFSEALSAAADGSTITLMRDCVLSSAIVPPANKAITVDGAGFRIIRYDANNGKIHLVDATTAGGNMTFTNVELNEGYFTCAYAYASHPDGALVNTRDGVAATVTLGPGTVLSGGRYSNALVRVANGATVNLDGCVVTGAVNLAIAASAGGTLGVKGATVVKDNAGGDIDVADGTILSLNGNLTGSVHVTVAGAEACEGQQFGTRTANWTGVENFVYRGSGPRLVVTESGPLAWYRRGFILTFK